MPEEIRGQIKEDKGASDSFDRMAAHLAANEVDITTDKIMLGMPLKMNPKTERFENNDKANALLTRKYRPGFVVPEKV